MTAHPIPPVWNEDSEILILGSFPSVRSREEAFFYAHPANRFWKVLAGLAGEAEPRGAERRREFLLRRRIALWDVIESCDIEGSRDASIRNAVPNDISLITERADIKAIFCNGETSYRLYCRHILPASGIDAVKLPSTSPANAAYSQSMLEEAWGEAMGRFLLEPPL